MESPGIKSPCKVSSFYNPSFINISLFFCRGHDRSPSSTATTNVVDINIINIINIVVVVIIVIGVRCADFEYIYARW